MGRVRENGIDTRLEIIRAGTRLFLERGFDTVSASIIAKEVGISKGNLAYHFPTKEALLYELVQGMSQFQWVMITEKENELKDIPPLFAYALEIAIQTAMCEDNLPAKELYVAAYTYPSTSALIKDWSSRKSTHIFGERLPEWSADDFRRIENLTSAVERGALVEPCSETFTLEQKIKDTLDCLLKIYEVPKAEREATIDAVLETDCRANGARILESFVTYINDVNDKALEEAKSKL